MDSITLPEQDDLEVSTTGTAYNAVLNGERFPKDISECLVEGISPITVAPNPTCSQPVTPSPQRRLSPRKSPFFPSASSSPANRKLKISGTESQHSTLPLASITSKSLGLIQEVLASKPFELLIAVIFLNQTRATVALPVLFQFLDRYPDAATLAAADTVQVCSTIKQLGLQSRRAETLTKLAYAWLHGGEPRKGRRIRTLHYPCLGDGKDILVGEELGDESEDGRHGAWEIGGLPGVGPYALDSWRIFCRDELRGVAPDGIDGAEPEWKRVLPQDKELRAYLRWRWLKEGRVWNPLTGKRSSASDELMGKARSGLVVWEDLDNILKEGTKSCSKQDTEVINDTYGYKSQKFAMM